MRRAAVAMMVIIWIGLGGSARAQDLKDRFNFKLTLTGLYAAEEESAVPARQAQVASPYELAYGDLRATVDARRLPGQFDLHLDGRVRLTGGFYSAAADDGRDQVTARGYLGGREYEVRQAWVMRRGQQWDFGLGRLVVNEADALRLDGARLWYRPSAHWSASLYGGSYPDPYSRSILDDYFGGYAFAGGGDGAYTYDRVWGSFSANGAFFGGNDDRGRLDPAAPAGRVDREAPRVWLTWTNYWRIVSWLDLYHDLVLDVLGAAGVQLTRLDVLATVRLGKHVSVRLGYDHLSPLAIEMWLTRLLSDRGHAIVTGTIENNLLVERTARDEARGQVEVTFNKLSIYGEGRFRRRALVSLTDDPQFVATGSQVAPGLAYDATLGLADRGSLGGVRAGLWASYIGDYRARNVVAGLSLGRGFLDERLSFDVAFLLGFTHDSAAGGAMLNPCTPPSALSSCFGARDGSQYEIGLTLTGAPSRHWLVLADYRLVADLTSTKTVDPADFTKQIAAPTVLTHVLLLRLEARY